MKSFLLISALGIMCMLTRGCIVVAQPTMTATVRHWTMANGLSSNEVYAVVMDQRSVLWIATKFGLNRFDGHSFKVYTASDNLYSNHISDLFMERGRYLWLFYKERAADVDQLLSIQVMDVFSGQIQSVENYLGSELPFAASDIDQIRIQEGALLFHKSSGELFCYDTATGLRQLGGDYPTEKILYFDKSRIWYTRGEADSMWLMANTVNGDHAYSFCMGSLKDHRFHWVSVNKKGQLVFCRRLFQRTEYLELVFVDPTGIIPPIIRCYSLAFGINHLDEVAYHQGLDAYWLVTENHAMLFREDGTHLYTYREAGAKQLSMSMKNPSADIWEYKIQEIGLRMMNFKRLSLLADQSVWQCSNWGLLAFHFTVEGSPWPATQPVVVEALQYSGKTKQLEDRTADLYERGSLLLRPEDRFITLKLSLAQQAQWQPDSKFFYRLKNSQSKWLEINDNILLLGNLPYGTPIVQIKATNLRAGAGNLLEIPVDVIRPYYLQVWFIVLCVLLVSAFFYGLYLYQLTQYKKGQALRTQIAADLHDEMGALLSRLTFQSEMVKYVSAARAVQILQDIAVTSRYAFDMMRDIVWSIDARNDANDNIILRMEKQLEEMLGPAGINYLIDSRAVMQQCPILPEVRQDVFFIFKEAVTNTVRHGKPWQVLVTLQQNYSFFQMEIQEQYAPGDALKAVPGLVAKSKKTGSGLQNMRFRADRIKAQLTIIPSHSGYSIRLTKKW
jgi:Histidine kinase